MEINLLEPPGSALYVRSTGSTACEVESSARHEEIYVEGESSADSLSSTVAIVIIVLVVMPGLPYFASSEDQYGGDTPS